MSVLGDGSGDIIGTDSGFALGVQTATQNDDIQLFDFSVDLLQAVLWQYNNAENLISLLQQKQDWYDENQQQFWQDWITNVFDLRTANQFGLTVWGIILGLQLWVNTPPVISDPIFGFEGSGGVNFDNGILGTQNGSSLLLPVETQRRALQLRYLQLTSSGTVPEINRALKYIFGDLGTAYLLDYGNMTQAYIFNFALPADLVYLFQNYDILPRPAGVQSTYVDATLVYFGFNNFNFNFDHGILGG